MVVKSRPDGTIRNQEPARFLFRPKTAVLSARNSITITFKCEYISFALEEMEQPVTLADMKPGQSARIESIDTTNPATVRLMVLGLIEGAIVRFEHAAIGGDPLEISVFGASMSIRKQQALHFQIVPE